MSLRTVLSILRKVAAPEMGCAWQLVPGANQEMYNGLNAIAPIQESDIWAVGSQGP
jgi:hypothetical protein